MIALLLAPNYVAYVRSVKEDLTNAAGNVAPFLREADARLQEGVVRQPVMAQSEEME